MNRRLLIALLASAVLVVGLVAGVVAGVVDFRLHDPDTPAGPAPAPAAATPSAETEVDPGGDLLVPGSGELAASGGTQDAGATPVTVRLPGVGVESRLETLRTDRSGRLQSPRDWQRAGWFADGTRPGDVGPAVIAGHVDSPTGPAVFDRLDELGSGDLVSVTLDDGREVEFRVDRTEVVPKGDFPTGQVYGPTPDAQLRLITCDGPYVRSSGGYQDNLVVWATAVAA